MASSSEPYRSMCLFLMWNGLVVDDADVSHLPICVNVFRRR